MKRALRYLLDTHYHTTIDSPVELRSPSGKISYEGAINTTEDMRKAVRIAYLEGYITGARNYDDDNFYIEASRELELLTKNKEDEK